MAPVLPPMRLINATILRDGALQTRSVAVADGQITRGPLPGVDLGGYFILPGIIDLHGDGFERHIAPRPSADFPLPAGLASTDREAAAHGITTAYLAQGWSWEGGLRGPDHAERLFAALDAYRPDALTDLRIQIRAEIHMVDMTERLIAAVRRHKIGYVIFNDHLDEGLAMQRTSPGDFALWARKAGISTETLHRALLDARDRQAQVPRHLCKLADAFDQLNVVYGSHDDPDGDTRERYRMIGARIAEFPTTRSAAVVARAMDCPVVMGAPNVVRGRSQAGNIAAGDLVAAGLCNCLVSDYHMPSLAAAAWALVDAGVLPLPRAWALISTNPAEILGLTDRGRIAPGLRADLAIVNAATRQVEATICAGRLTYLAGYAAQRFMASALTLPMAAE